MTIKEALEKRRDEFGNKSSQYCYCAGPTCSGCESNTKKLVGIGADSMIPLVIKLYEALDTIRLGSELEVPFDEARFRYAQVDDLSDIANETLTDLHKELGML